MSLPNDALLMIAKHLTFMDLRQWCQVHPRLTTLYDNQHLITIIRMKNPNIHILKDFPIMHFLNQFYRIFYQFVHKSYKELPRWINPKYFYDDAVCELVNNLIHRYSLYRDFSFSTDLFLSGHAILSGKRLIIPGHEFNLYMEKTYHQYIDRQSQITIDEVKSILKIMLFQ